VDKDSKVVIIIMVHGDFLEQVEVELQLKVEDYLLILHNQLQVEMV
jgi:hypothetical protein